METPPKKVIEPHIELNVFLKKQGLASTGGQAKVLIQSGVVKVNGDKEFKNRRKLHLHDMVEHNGVKYVVTQKYLR